MILVTDYLGPAYPTLDMLSSDQVRVWVPTRGWVQQNSNPNSRVSVPLDSISLAGLKRWLQYRARKLPSQDGALVLMHRGLSATHISVGLFHDTRSQIYLEEDHCLNIREPPGITEKVKKMQLWLP